MSSGSPYDYLFSAPSPGAFGFASPGMREVTAQAEAAFKERMAERPPPGFFRLCRRADFDAVEEAAGGVTRLVGYSYWGDVLVAAKEKRQVVIPDVDCATAWCVVKAGFDVKPMKGPDLRTRQRLAPASEQWALLLPEVWARKYAQPYFEMDLAGEMGGVSLLEYLVTFGGVDPKHARACAARYSKVRRGDPLRLDERDVTGLLGAADGREAALAGDRESPE